MPKRFSSSVTGVLRTSSKGSTTKSSSEASSRRSRPERTKSEGAKSDDSNLSHTERMAARAEKALKHDTSDTANPMGADQDGFLLNLGANGQVPFVGREKELASIGQVIDLLVAKRNIKNISSEEAEEEEKGAQNPRVISIVGAPGSGKSRLAAELKSQVLERDGFFARGKCEFCQPRIQEQPATHSVGNSNANTAYAALSHAMKDLTDQILARDFDMGIRRRLQEAVKPQDAQVLTEIFPSLSTILECEDDSSHQEEAQQEGSSQEQRARRRRFLFHQFMRVLLVSSIDYCDEDIEEGGEQKPQNEEAFALVLVIDDVQWMDETSLDLVSALVRDQELDNFLLVTTLRPMQPHQDGEDSRPFVRETKNWQEQKIPVRSYPLQSLDSDSVNTILATVLDTERELTSDLATIVREKTNGNAFFALEFIKALVDQKLLSYSYGSMRWKWDTTKVQALVIQGNSPVGLLMSKLNRLPSNQQLMLMVTACFGGTFEKGLMKRIMQHLEDESQLDGKEDPADQINVEELLQSLCQSGLLGHHEDLYFIAHDLIKEAALEFISHEKIRELKLRMGEHILTTMIHKDSGSTSSALLFLGVGLCNAGYTPQVTTTTIQPTELADYNLLAGERALRESAFASALQYMEKGVSLVEDAKDGSSKDKYDKLLAGAAEASHCTGNAGKVHAYADELLQRDCSMEHRLQMLNFKVVLSFIEGDYEGSIDHGWSAIKLLKVATFPRRPNMFHVMKALIKTKRRLRNHTRQTLLALPVLEDENRINAQKFFSMLQDASFVCNPTFFLVSQLKCARWAVKYGVSRYTPSAFTLYGNILQSVLFHDVKSGKFFGDISLELAERMGVKETIAKTTQTTFGLIHHWTNDIRECHTPISFSSKLAMECGDTTNSLTGYWFIDVYSWVCARVSLQELARDLGKHVALSREYRNDAVGDGLTFLAEHLRKLCMAKDTSFLWLDYVMDSGYANRKQEKQALAVWAFRRAIALESHFLLGDMDEALKCAWDLEGVAKICMGMGTLPRIQYYRGLVFLAAAVSGRDSKRSLREVRSILAMLNKWVDNGNVNCIHMAWLLEAEVAKIKQQADTAKKLYGDAIRMSNRCLQTHDTALSNQYASTFFLESGDRSRAAYHMQQAINSFRDWGALTLVRRLQEKHADLLKDAALVCKESCVFTIPG